MSTMDFGSFQKAMSLLQLQLPTFVGLPDEVVSLIVNELPRSSLSSLSLVSKHIRRLVLPEMFGHLSLSRWTAAELDGFHDALFVSQAGQPSVLGDIYLQSVSCQLSADTAGGKSFKANQVSLQRVLSAIKGIKTLDTELDLAEDIPGAFVGKFIPAIDGLLNSVKGRFRQIVLHIGSYEMEQDLEDSEDSTSDDKLGIEATISMIIECFPIGSISGLHLTGLGLVNLPDALRSAITSPALIDLRLTDCGPALRAMHTDMSLKNLSMVWGFGQNEDVAGLEAALQIIKMNSLSIERVTLQSLVKERFTPLIPPSVPLALPKLTRLQIVDNCSQAPISLLENILKSVQLPFLQLLILETSNLLMPEVNLSVMLDELPSLRKITLTERPANREPGDPIFYSHMHALERLCRSRDIILESNTLVRCDAADEFKYQFDRLSCLSPSLRRLSLNCRFDTLIGLAGSVTLDLPNAKHVMLGLSEIIGQTSGDAECESTDDSVQPSLRDLFEHIHAPNLKVLQLTLFKNGPLAKISLDDLLFAIENRLYPKLEAVTGAIMPSAYMPSEDLKFYKEKMRAVCAERGIDASEIDFIDEWSDSDDESILSEPEESEPEEDNEDESEFDDISSDSGESGFGDTSRRLLKTIIEEDGEDDSDEELPSETSDNTSSDTSWTTDEDDDQ